MKITRFAILAAAMVGAAMGLASPASAELLDGTYKLTYFKVSGPPSYVVVTSCGAGCKHIQMWGGYEPSDFHLQGNTWTSNSKDYEETIDNNTLLGTASSWGYRLDKVV
jgi:hypothetical protein